MAVIEQVTQFLFVVQSSSIKGVYQYCQVRNLGSNFMSLVHIGVVGIQYLSLQYLSLKYLVSD